MPESKSLVIEVPTISKTRTSSADQGIVKLMVKDAKEGTWVTDGSTYPKHGDTANASQVYRRALAKAANLEAHQVKSRVWGVDKGGNIVTDENATAEWRFALTLDPTRQKRTRNRASATPAA